MPYKFFGFATVPLSFGGATVFHQTKPFEFYIIFSLSLSLTSPLSQLRVGSQLRARSGANSWVLMPIWCYGGCRFLSGVDLVPWVWCYFWKSRGCWVEFWLPWVEFWSPWVSGLSLVAGGAHMLEVCFFDYEENWESWEKKGKKNGWRGERK